MTAKGVAVGKRSKFIDNDKCRTAVQSVAVSSGDFLREGFSDASYRSVYVFGSLQEIELSSIGVKMSEVVGGKSKNLTKKEGKRESCLWHSLLKRCRGVVRKDHGLVRDGGVVQHKLGGRHPAIGFFKRIGKQRARK